MRYLNKIIFLNSAHIPYAEVKLDGNVHFIGTQGVGKSTLLRALFFFYNADKLKLGIPKEKVADLRFIRAYRYFLHCMDTLAAISKRFADLKIEPTDEERQAQIDRPDRGIAAVVRKYVQIMNGAVSPASVYGMEWSVVYEAFESTTNDVIEPRNLSRIQTSKIKRR